MTDQTSQFFAILTAVGEAKQANANALGVPWSFAQMGVGDANGSDPVPLRDQTRLLNERRRAALNQVKVDPKNPNMIIAEQVIPPDVGGWWIREIGLYDSAGDLVAVANCAPSFKPLLSQGTGKTQIVRLNIIVTSAANVQLKIDPAVVLATRQFVIDGFAPIVSPAFAGDPKAPTPQQFDRDKSIATTEFVANSMGSYRSVEIVLVPTKQLTPAHVGYLMVLSGNGSIVATLPPASSVPAGSSISFFVDHSLYTSDTIVASGADTINAGYQSFSSSLTVNNGDFVTLVSTGLGVWCATNRSVKLEQSSDFRVVNSGNAGYRYLPGGMIEQWGNTASVMDSAEVTFPIQFKNRVAFVATHDHTGPAGLVRTIFQVTGLTLTGFTALNLCTLVRGSSNVGNVTLAGCPWRAWGW